MPAHFLIDTNVSVAFLDDEPALLGAWTARAPTQIALCSVVRAELNAGAWGSREPFDMLARIDRLFSVHDSMPFDDIAAAEFGRLAADLRRRGQPIGVADMMIAAIALANNLTVVTRNLKHFKRVAGLKVTRW